MDDLTVLIATYVCNANPQHKKTVEVNPEYVAPARCATDDCFAWPTNVKRVGRAYWNKLIKTQRVEKVLA